MEVVFHPYVLILLGPAVGILIARYLTTRLLWRGYRIWAFLAGVVMMLAILTLWEMGLNYSFREAYRDYGPCSTCYEWSFMPYLLWWGSWGVGFILYGLISLASILRLPPNSQKRDKDWPEHFPLWMGIIALFILITGVGLWSTRAHLRSKQVEDLASVKEVFNGMPLQEVAAVPLPIDVSWVNLMAPPILNGGIRFSDEGSWMVLHDEDGLEFWDLEELRPMHRVEKVRPFWRVLGALSHEGKQAAIWLNGQLILYDLEDGWEAPLWQIQEVNGLLRSISFSEMDNLILLLLQDRLVRVGVENGQIRGEVTFDFPEGHQTPHLSRDGMTVAVQVDDRIHLYDTLTGKGFNELDISRYLKSPEDSEILGYMQSLQSNDLIFINLQRSMIDEVLIIRFPSGEVTILDTEFLNDGMITAAMDPEGRLLVIASRRRSMLWDVTHQKDLGSLPTGDAITALAFTPDGRMLVAATAGGHLRFYSSSGE